jgi:hypothetical protein
MNTREVPRRFRIGVSGLPTIALAGPDEVEIPAATTRQVPIGIRIDPGVAAKGSHRIEIEVRALDDPSVAAREKSVFLVR